jgi:alanyl-tRNA synthetase
MTSRDIRTAFVAFFAERGHRVVPSSPLVLPTDPTLLFANAGMNQFKDVFTGRERREYRRAVSSQKCLRVSGKHNDLEMVGRTPRHHTFFEMLGNFSFGDYFKKDALPWAWELIRDRWGIPEERLWVTVFGGSENAEPDDEAFALWRDRVGVRAERILALDEKHNFWRMGETGPCGPCSEIHVDLGEHLTSVSGESTPATDDRRFLEIWNLVFMQFDQTAEGGLRPLPAPSIDTGMGLERIASVLQGRDSNYDTDLFRPLIDAAAHRAGTAYGRSEDADFSLRVIADHARALCFLVADGVVPANDKRGYVLRRLVRRAIRHGRKLGIEGPFLQEVTPVVLDLLGGVYPELLAAREAIVEVGRREEERFAETLATGLQLLEEALARHTASGSGADFPGEELFKLYDTFGMPLDLAQDMVQERGLTLDVAGFERELEAQRQRARASWKGGRKAEAARAGASLREGVRSSFAGHDVTRIDSAAVVAVLGSDGPPRTLEAGEEGEVVLAATPFYAEAGGQVGDTGILVGESGRAAVLDTQRAAPGVIAHRVRLETGRIAVGDSVRAEVDDARRDAIRRNHTATHLLHAALREVVGTHVKQAGSLVAPDRLRFDFTHFSGLSDRALADVEGLANRKILEDIPVEAEEMDLDDALRSGAMALFGEKYGDRVRVVTIGEFSKELCGGTHTRRTGEIGLLKLTEEHGVASGTRRVEAVTGQGSLERFRRWESIVRRLEGQLSAPGDGLLVELEKRLEHARALERELERLRMRSVRDDLARKAAQPEVVGGVKVIAQRVDGLSPQEMRLVADDLRVKLGSGVVILGRAEGEKVSLLVAVTEDLHDRLAAGAMIRELARIIGGGGGGRRDLAEAGGKDPSRLDEAVREGVAMVARSAGAVP